MWQLLSTHFFCHGELLLLKAAAGNVRVHNIEDATYPTDFHKSGRRGMTFFYFLARLHHVGELRDTGLLS